jgi:hypothetical protein
MVYGLGIHILWKASSLSKKALSFRNELFPSFFQIWDNYFFVFWGGGGRGKGFHDVFSCIFTKRCYAIC